MNVRNYIPASLRLRLKRFQRTCSDILSGDRFKFSSREKQSPAYTYRVSLKQPIMKTAFLENKIHNIRRGSEEIAQIVVLPGEILSFWNIIGQPSKKNDYKVGRNLIAGKLSEDYGGGLCQLSSIMYHISLTTGLQVLERYNHSVDIYAEEERFTPLGADATVVYGYKDFRIKNPYDFPLRFSFQVNDEEITCYVESEKEIQAKQIDFKRNPNGNTVRVDAVAGDQVLDQSVYIKKSV